VLELACGTGYWTAAVADSVDSIHATDASTEVLEIARAKNLDPAKVSFATADAWNPAQPHGEFNAGLAAFWWSHVSLDRLRGFLERLHASLQPGARIVFADNRFVSGSSTPISRTDDLGNTYQVRRLDDDSTHEVLKNFPSSGQLRSALKPYAAHVDVREFEYFWSVVYQLKHDGCG
jgi:ubiquinone/menaquinone biosynthesis C-methylase UbiE